MGAGRTICNRQSMALGDIPRSEQPWRLDSWKEIAEYLRRDVRTAARWESQGLPLHRVPGGKRRSVYAFTHEIDAWLASQPDEVPAAIPPDTSHGEFSVPPVVPDINSGVEPVPMAAPTLSHSFRTLVIGVAVGLVLLAIGVTSWSRSTLISPDSRNWQVTATAAHVSIADAAGESRVVHHFAPGAQLDISPLARMEDLDADGAPEIMVAVSVYDKGDGLALRSGEVLNLSPSGDVRWRFAFDDQMTFGSGRFTGPWVVASRQSGPTQAPTRVAVAGHDTRWWPSVVTVIDSDGRRHGAFVNPGWVESLVWLSGDDLAIAGFNNSRDEAMVAILDASHLEGQAPGSAGSEYACLTCAQTVPRFYATLARSELNRLTAGRFNRARVMAPDGSIVVTTVEISRENGGDATAMYEFDRDLRLMRVRYSDTYWDEHQRLEREGRLTHSRKTCPERDGPAVHIWDATRGWTRVTPLAESSARSVQ